MNDGITIKGHVKIKIGDKISYVDNVVVDTGKNYVAQWLAQTSPSGKIMSYIAVGSGTSLPVYSDTTLEAEVLSRGAATLSSSTNTLVLAASIQNGSSDVDISEAGIFSDSVDGTMLSRVVFPTQTISAYGTIEITWYINFL